jgi:hypothetical protein
LCALRSQLFGWGRIRSWLKPRQVSVTQYHAYQIGPDGRIQSGVDLNCADDEAAIEAAKAFVGENGVELWQGTRMVARLEAPPSRKGLGLRQMGTRWRAAAATFNRVPRRDEDLHRRSLPTTAPSSPSRHEADSLRRLGANLRAGLDSLFRNGARPDVACRSPRSACGQYP